MNAVVDKSADRECVATSASVMICVHKDKFAIKVCAFQAVVKIQIVLKVRLVSTASVPIHVAKLLVERMHFVGCRNIDPSACVQMASKGNQARNVNKWNVNGMMIVVHSKCVYKAVAKIHAYSLELVEQTHSVRLSIAVLNVLVL